MEELVVGCVEAVEQGDAVFFRGHVAQLVLQTDGMDVHCLVAHEDGLHDGNVQKALRQAVEHHLSEVLGLAAAEAAALRPGPGQEAVIGLQPKEAAGRQVGLLVVVDDRGTLQEKLVDVSLDGEHVPGDELRPVGEGLLGLLHPLELHLLGLL